MVGIVFRFEGIDKIILFEGKAFLGVHLFSEKYLDSLDSIYSFSKYEFQTIHLFVTPKIVKLKFMSDEECYVDLVKRVYLNLSSKNKDL